MKKYLTIFFVLSLVLFLGFIIAPEKAEAHGISCDTGNDGCLGFYSSIFDCSIFGIDHTHPVNEGGSCTKNGQYTGGSDFCSPDNTSVDNRLYVCSSGSCSAVGPIDPHQSCGSCGCSSGSCTPLPQYYGTPCNLNSCWIAGGTIQCDGQCSGSTPSLPAGYGQVCNINACGQAGGTVQCNGSCSGSTPSLPAGYGNSCGGGGTIQCDGSCSSSCAGNQGSSCNINACGQAGGTIQCNGSCSGSTPSLPAGYGNSCGDGGTIQCDGSCSSPCDEDQGDSCTSNSNSCGMTNNGVVACNGSCSASTPSNSLCSNPPSVVPSVVIQGDNCGIASPSVTFSWEFSDSDAGDTQSAYRIRVREGSSTIHNSGKISSSSQQYAPPLGVFSYNTVYSWDIKVWDTDSPPDNSVWTSGPGFTTISNQYPTPDFSWSPLAPAQNDSVAFVDESITYGGASITSWSWTFEDGSPSSSSQENPFITFSSIGTKAVTLQVTDSSGFSCSDSTQDIKIGIAFPEWEEIPPFGAIINMFTSFISSLSAALY